MFRIVRWLNEEAPFLAQVEYPRSQGQRDSDEIKAWQEKSEEHARSFFDELTKRGEKEKDQFKGMVKDIVKEVVSELNLATKDDLKKLKKELSKKVDS